MELELCYQVSSQVAKFLAMVLTALNLVFLLRPYMRKKRDAYFAAGVYGLVTIVLFLIPVVMDSWIAYSAGTVLSFLYFMWADGRNREQKIFLYVTFFVLRYLTQSIVIEVIRFISAKAYATDLLKNSISAMAVYLILEQMGWVVLRFLFLYASVRILNYVYKRKWENISVRELAYMLIPQMAVLLFGALDMRYYDLYLKCLEAGMFKESIPASGYTCLYYIIAYLTVLVLVVSYHRLRDGQEELRQIQLADSQMAEMKNHIRQVESLYGDIRAMRHDMGNHIQAMEHLIGEDDGAAASSYLKRLKREWQQVAPEIATGNPVTDVIIKEKMREAERKQISFQCDFHFPRGINADAFDVGVILSNALNNCLESANGEQPWIVVSSYRKNQMFLITVKNSYTGQLRWEGEEGLPLSTKKGEGHGIGLANIGRVARSYLGDVIFEQEEDSVTLRVMLQMKQVV